MSGENKTSAYEAVDVETAEFLVPQPRKSTKWRLAAVSMAAVGVVMLIGLNQAGVFAPRPRTPFEHLTNMHDKLISAFSSRALTETSDFNLAFEVLFNEEAASDPDAMGVTADMKIGDSKKKWPVMTIGFNAADGKQDDLHKKIGDIWHQCVEEERKHGSKKNAKEMAKAASVEKTKDGNVALIIEMPKDGKEAKDDQEMKAEFKKHNPTFHAELSFGRTIKQMYDNVNSNILVLPHGIHAKVGAGIASTIFDFIGDALPRELKRSDAVQMLPMMKGFSALTETQKLIYKKDAAKTWANMPTLKKEAKDMKRSVEKSPFKKHVKGLDELMDGISGISIQGLPMGWEIDAKFNNFHPAPMLASMAM